MGKLCRLHLLLLALLLPGVSFAQNLLKVQGCVTDEQNEPLIGATVQTKDKSKGTITDSGGNYVFVGSSQGFNLGVFVCRLQVERSKGDISFS